MEQSALSKIPQPSSAEQLIQLLVPIYNEGENVVVLYNTLLEERVPFDSLKFIYDLDTDITLPFIEQINRRDPRVVAEKNQYGRGVLNALRWGFAHVTSGPVIVMMGDNSDKLSIVPEMVRLWQGGALLVAPSRYMKGGEQHGGGVLKSNLSRLAGLSLKLIGFPTADPTNNFKLYDGDWLRAQTIESVGGFEVALELSYKAYITGAKIAELPTVWRDRTMGQSNFKLWKWLPKYLKWYFRTIGAILTRPFR